MPPYQVFAPFALGTARTSGGVEECVVIHHDGSVRSLAGLVETEGGLFALLQNWVSVRQAVEYLDPDDLPTVDNAHVLAPIRFPRKVVCIAANHRDHLAEVGADVAKAISNWNPFFFLKTPTNSVVGPLDSVRIPTMVEDARLDWEGELGAVVGNRLTNGNRDDARAVVVGYVPLNDLSARGALVRADTALEPTKYDWVSAKSFDGSLPMGPGMVPASFVPDPNQLRIVVTVDGVVRQDGSTSGLVSDVYEVVAAASRIMTLEPGDVVATGTPGGVGGVRGLQLERGNAVTVEVESVGSITTTIV